MSLLKRITIAPFPNERMKLYATGNESDFRHLYALQSVFRRKRVLHVNSTADGGGVAEMLRGRIAFECALGIESRWYVLSGSTDFFTVTKKIHNGLQGDPVELPVSEQDTYRDMAGVFAKDFQSLLDEFRPDIIILHDPQPLPLVSIERRFAPTIVRLHVDLSTPYAPILEFLTPFLLQASHIILSSDNYRAGFSWYPTEQVSIIRPSIDPLTEKNALLDLVRARDILARHGIDTARPFVTQISRFDPWKDPLGAIDAYRIAKRSLPGLQLVLAGFIEAADDPEALEWVGKVRDAAAGDPDIFIFSDLLQLRDLPSDDLFINALNTLTAVTLQMSRREGFGLTITEAMWKGRVVIARPSRGALLQIAHGEDGFIADTPEAVAGHIVDVLRDDEVARSIGKRARISVTENFLLTHYIALSVDVYAKVLA